MPEELKSGMSKKAAVVMAGITGVSTLCASTVVGSDGDAVFITIGGMAVIAAIVIAHIVTQTIIDVKKPK